MDSVYKYYSVMNYTTDNRKFINNNGYFNEVDLFRHTSAGIVYGAM